MTAESKMQPWLVALATSVAATVVTFAFGPRVHEESPFMMFTASVAISSCLGGFGPGVMATVLGALAGVYFFIPPVLSFHLPSLTRLIDIGEFLFVGSIINFLSSSLRKARMDAEGAVRARNELISIASHELKTPLTSLALINELLLRMIGDENAWRSSPALIRETAERSTEQTRRLSKAVDDMLSLGRAWTERLRAEPREFDLSALLRDVALRLGSEAQRAGSVIEVENGGPVYGIWDQLRIEQVITNLLTNAIKYGAGRPIQAGVSSSPGLARLWVQDHGIGITREDQPRIFEKFERATSSKAARSMGLGLYIVKQIVNAHGGRIRVRSEPGRGSRFTVELPLSLRERAGSSREGGSQAGLRNARAPNTNIQPRRARGPR